MVRPHCSIQIDGCRRQKKRISNPNVDLVTARDIVETLHLASAEPEGDGPRREAGRRRSGRSVFIQLTVARRRTNFVLF